MDISTINLTATADLGMVTWTLFAATTPDGVGGAAEIQIWAEYEDGHFQLASPRDGNGTPIPIVVPYGGIPGQVTFVQAMDVGTIKAARVVLFAVGSNFSTVVYDKYPVPVACTIATAQVRVTVPVLALTGAPSDIAPGGSTFAVAGANALDWATSLDITGKRFPARPDKAGRSGLVWYPPVAANPITFSMTFKEKRCVSFYVMNGNQDASTYHIDMLDSADKVLASLDIKDVNVGTWARFNAVGAVKFRFVKSLCCAIMFDPAMTGAATALDTATGGDWVGKYGADGYVFPQTFISLPDYLAGDPAADGKIHVPFRVKVPFDYHMPDGGFWIQVKGTSLDPANPSYIFLQEWVQIETGHAAEGYTVVGQIAPAPDRYKFVDGDLALTKPSEGVYSMQFMLFNSFWNMLQWQAGPVVEVGGDSWVAKADPAKFPALFANIQALGKWEFVNHGNAPYTLLNRPDHSGWARYPANFNAGYFAALRVVVGAKVARIVFDGDAYLDSAYYRHFLDSAVEQAIMGGVVPYIEPQVPPKGGVDGLSALWQAIVDKFAAYPILYGICNEPSAYPAWSEWKKVLLRIAGEIRARVPNAYIVGSLEGWSKDARAACKDPLPAGTVNCYSLHAYISGAELAVQIGDGSIPVWVQEFIDPDERFFAVIASAKNIVGVSAWTWNTLGDDALPLTATASPFTPTERGAKMLAYAAKAKAGAYDNGTIPIPTPVPVPDPGPSPSPTPTPGPDPTPVPVPVPIPTPTGITRADLDSLRAELTAAFTAAIKASVPDLSQYVTRQQEQTDIADAKIVPPVLPGPGTDPPPTPAPPPVADGGNAKVNFGPVPVAGWAQNVGIVTGQAWPDKAVPQGIDVSAPGCAPVAIYQGYATNPAPGGSVSVTAPASASGKVRLHLAETFYQEAGKRVVDVYVGGKKVLASFDVFTVAGAAFKAVWFECPAAAGAVVELRSVGGSFPLLCAIEGV